MPEALPPVVAVNPEYNVPAVICVGVPEILAVKMVLSLSTEE